METYIQRVQIQVILNSNVLNEAKLVCSNTSLSIPINAHYLAWEHEIPLAGEALMTTTLVHYSSVDVARRDNRITTLKVKACFITHQKLLCTPEQDVVIGTGES